jgi:hypothetical protein
MCVPIMENVRLSATWTPNVTASQDGLAKHAILSALQTRLAMLAPITVNVSSRTTRPIVIVREASWVKPVMLSALESLKLMANLLGAMATETACTMQRLKVPHASVLRVTAGSERVAKKNASVARMTKAMRMLYALAMENAS